MVIAKAEVNKNGPYSGLLFLAPSALVFLPAFILARIAVEHDGNYKWAQHRLTAVAFFGAFASVWLFGPWKQGILTVALSLMGFGFGIAALILGLPDFSWVFVAAGIFVAIGFHQTEYRSADLKPPTSKIEMGALSLFATLSFWICSRLFWWQSFEAAAPSWEKKLFFLILSALMVYSTSKIFGVPNLEQTSRKWSVYLIDVVALFSLGVAVARTGALNGNPNFAHHWSVFVEPSELVRQGHVLLGEVPSQYGFLSMLLLAAIPTDDRFTALFLINCLLLWFSGAVIYFSLRTLRSGWWWQLISAFLSISAVALICGNASDLSGPMTYPSMGGMRFVWVYSIVGYLIWHQLKAQRDDEIERSFLGFGTLLWLVGVLWSVESAAYATAIWFPAASIVASPNNAETNEGPGRCKPLLFGICRVVARAGFSLGVAITGIEFFYRFHLGRAPQWSAYWEYAIAFSDGFSGISMNPEGGVWLLLLLHCVLLASLISFDINRQRFSTALIWSAWGTLWSVSTYYVSLSHGNNITNLAPILLLVVAAWGHAWRPVSQKTPCRLWLWLTLPAFLSMILWLVLSQPMAIKREFDRYSIESHPGKLRQHMPQALVDLIDTCAQSKPDPYSVVAPRAYDTVSVDHSLQNPEWIPIDSLPLLRPLPVQRRTYYLDVYTDHGRKPGWLISFVPRHETTEWIFQYTEKRYVTDLVLTNSNWVARHYVPREESTPRPASGQ